ncbi:MAG: hypothetical protein DME90_04575 [Verrucomicrobia bacterium]|nr:MAG: hypothetical protein DME90_04575 [Verrucomicrobiota bacterium]
MLCIGTGKMVQDENRMRYVPELYFKSPVEMREVFRDFPEAISNTLEIGERCHLQLEFGCSKYPEYPVPSGKTREGYLRELCYQGLRERYGARATADAELLNRLDYELGVLEKTGFVSYLLIVWDFIHCAKERRIPVGPGRGSAAGSMVTYVLGITDIDPLQFGLIFERFLNPDRVSPPDIDVDFCEARRGEVLEYVRQCRPSNGLELSRCRSHRKDDSERTEHYARFSGRKKSGIEKGGGYRAGDPAAF